MLDEQPLRRTLARIDGKGYKAYKDIQGSYDLSSFELHIDHVQGDPFASPSKVRVRVPQRAAGLPESLFKNPIRRVALEDWLARRVDHAIYRTAEGRRGSGKSGLIRIDAGRQEVLERTAIVVTPEWVEARLHVGLPARGRSVLGRQATAILLEEIPRIVQQALLWQNLPQDAGKRFVATVENYEHIRRQLAERAFVAFVADGAILPRASGAGDQPLAGGEAVPFRAPDSLRVTFDLLHPGPDRAKQISGMGIPNGVTLIVGGGYHGKSTLLHALERGVYPHIPGDGREYVVTNYDAVKIRAEDGRRVERVNISPFISNLPYGRSTTAFSTDDASGSTSQAANIVEAVDVGAQVLLLDEDTSATNFMVRDARMQALVHKENEPITPFLDRVRELYEGAGVSTILVMGGSGDYFDVADTVIMMRDYLPYDVTDEAEGVAGAYPTQRQSEVTEPMTLDTARIPLEESFDPVSDLRGRREVKIDAKAVDLILFGTEPINLRGVEQLVDWSQSRAVGYAIHLATERFMDGTLSLREVVEAVERFFDRHGLDSLDPFHRDAHHPGDFARPRRYEIAAAINRLRTVQMRQR
ncbi:MAG: ABC-ATPase domain-containing protein [Ardenticatenaceae bacterium]